MIACHVSQRGTSYVDAYPRTVSAYARVTSPFSVLNSANVGVITIGVIPAAFAICTIASTSSGPLAGVRSDKATSFTPALIVTMAG